MPGIILKESEHVDGAIRRFKKQCEKEGIMSELRKREYYEKPCVKRKRKRLNARKRLLKKIRTQIRD